MSRSIENQMIFLPTKAKLAVVNFAKNELAVSLLPEHLYRVVFDTYKRVYHDDEVSAFKRILRSRL
jgi:hypothetical protein